MCLPGGSVGANRQKPVPKESPRNAVERAAFAIRGRQAEYEMISRQERGLAERRMLTSGEVGRLEALKREYERAQGKSPSKPYGMGPVMYGLGTSLLSQESSFFAQQAAKSQTPVYEGQYQTAEWYEKEIAKLKNTSSSPGVSAPKPNL